MLKEKLKERKDMLEMKNWENWGQALVGYCDGPTGSNPAYFRTTGSHRGDWIV